MNFHLLLQSIPEDKLIWKPTVCSLTNLEGQIRSLGAILSNLQVIYHLICPKIRPIYQYKMVISLKVRRKMSVDNFCVEHSGQKILR